MTHFKTRTINFDFNFKYPRAGQFDESNAITLAEPGYLHQRVFHQMRAYSTLAEKGIVDWLSNSTQGKQRAEDAAAAPEGNANKISALETLRMGLSPEKYIELVDYVQKALTGAKALAWVGSDTTSDPRDRFEINHAVWESISKEGGMEAVELIISEFAGFFLGSQSPKNSSTTETAVGSNVHTMPVAMQKEPSPSRKR